MKQFIKYSIIAFLSIFFYACEEEESGLILQEDSLVAPSDVSAIYQISDDNSGKVTVTPFANSASSFEIVYGDTAQVEEEVVEPTIVKPGESAEHIYAEGEYTITITAISATGLETEITQPIVIKFDPPSALDFTVETDELGVTVTPTAEGAFSFEVYFGEDPEAEPVQLMPEESASFTYAEDGTYEITVVAIGAAIERTELTKSVTVERSPVPLTAAPTPTLAPGAVISLFSDEYSDVNVDTWRTEWSDVGLYEEIEIEGNPVKRYNTLGFVGIETASSQVDATEMTHVRFDVWSIDGEGINLNIVDFGADGSFEGGDDSNQELAFDIPVTGEWVTIDVPLADFTGLTGRTNLTQYIFVGNPFQNASYFIDNFFFYNENGPVGEAPLGLPLDFSTDAQTFGTFNGASFALESDPNNASNQVGNIMNSGAEFEGMVLGLEQAVDFSADKVIRMKFFTLSPNTQVLVKFENGDPAQNVEVVEIATDFGWNDMSFDFTEANGNTVNATGTYNTIVIFVDGPLTKPGSYLFDDIEQTGIGLPLDFNSVRQTMGTFNGAGFEIAANPEEADDPVGQLTNTGNDFEGLFLGLEEAVDFSADGKIIKLNFYAAAANTPVLVKFENGTEDPVEVSATAENAGWNQLTFDFTAANGGAVDATGSYLNVVIFADLAAAVPGVHYIDDIRQVK